MKDITPIETYKVETIDTVSFENSHLANLRDLDQNSNVQLSHTTPPGISDLHPNTPGTVESCQLLVFEKLVLFREKNTLNLQPKLLQGAVVHYRAKSNKSQTHKWTPKPILNVW